MPFKAEKACLAGTDYDRRKKLTPEQRDEIIKLYPTVQSQRKLAAMFGVSRRLITFILDPEKAEENRKRLKERKDEGHYKPSKEKWAAVMREHRQYKNNLYKCGRISIKPTNNT